MRRSRRRDAGARRFPRVRKVTVRLALEGNRQQRRTAMRTWATAGRLVAVGRDAAGGSALAQRVLKRIGMACVVASTLGAVDVFLLLWLVLPPPREAAAHFPEAEIANAVAFAIFLPLTLAIGWAWGTRLARPWRRFLDEGREATEEERIATLRYPLRSAKMGALLWGIGALLFVAINLRFSGEVAFHVGSTIVLGGLVTPALTYLLTERLMRSVTARALADAAPPRLCGPGVQGRLTLAWAFATGVPLLGLGLLGTHVLTEGASLERVAVSVLVPSVAAGMVGLLATVLVARSVGEPLVSLRDAVERLEEGDLDVAVPVDDGSEVGLLQSGFNNMVVGLRERERPHDLFGRHVGTEVARNALDRPVALGGEERRGGGAVRRPDRLDGARHTMVAGGRRLAAQPLLRHRRRHGRRPRRVGQQVRGRRRPVRVRGAAARRRLRLVGPGRGPRAAGSAPAGARRGRCGRRDLGRTRGGGERRRRASVRVHGDREARQRGGAAVRARQATPRASARLGGGARARERAGRRVTGGSATRSSCAVAASRRAS